MQTNLANGKRLRMTEHSKTLNDMFVFSLIHIRIYISLRISFTVYRLDYWLHAQMHS